MTSVAPNCDEYCRLRDRAKGALFKTLSKQIFEKCVFFLIGKFLFLYSLLCIVFFLAAGRGVVGQVRGGLGTLVDFFYIAGSLSLSLSSFLSHFELFFTELI